MTEDASTEKRSAEDPRPVRTIGVAIGVPDPWGRVLQARRAAAGDPMARFIPAHLTLLGPTEVAAADQDEIEAHLAWAARRQRPFSLGLRGTGTFRPVTSVVFVAVGSGADECEALASAVRSGPLRRDLAYPYHPHVTVAHDVSEEALDRVFAELADFEANFQVDAFTLFTHGPDNHWRPRRRFELG